jgi:hypothetical protein
MPMLCETAAQPEKCKLIIIVIIIGSIASFLSTDYTSIPELCGVL